MDKLNFRDLRADEIECRIQQVNAKKNALVLLLYKDARCDMNMLDETVGPMNWKREHTRDNANCIVSLWDTEKGQWVSKEDTGKESNTEAEKGLASDSFKRACFNWGIGRELYTAPFIWVTGDKCNIKDGKCFDKFLVDYIKIENKQIVALSITNITQRCNAFSFGLEASTTEKPKGTKKAKNEPSAPQTAPPPPEPQEHRCKECGKLLTKEYAEKSIQFYGAPYCSKACGEKNGVKF